MEVRKGPDFILFQLIKKNEKNDKEIRETELILGEPYLGIRNSEHDIVQYRRSSS